MSKKHRLAALAACATGISHVAARLRVLDRTKTTAIRVPLALFLRKISQNDPSSTILDERERYTDCVETLIVSGSAPTILRLAAFRAIIAFFWGESIGRILCCSDSISIRSKLLLASVEASRNAERFVLAAPHPSFGRCILLRRTKLSLKVQPAFYLHPEFKSSYTSL